MNSPHYRNVIGFGEIPTFHDAELFGIAHHRADRELRLQFRRTNGDTGTFRLTGVIAQRVVDFADQNIVSRLLISPAYPFSSAEIAHWLAWLGGRADFSPGPADPERVAQCVDDFSAGRHALFVLEPSAGAEMAVLCETILLRLDSA
ncbi:hypothetical protein EGY31_20720 [Burkholderia multivorans]|uniref:hypothetical protein n=1 Tax=Burkholderia ubonensis TaxID=101571 RepID=UPI000F6EBD95|nr:hypothetical protein [Burkholderia ubonensis]AYZ65703.1 hypothetical protein EGY31_20720 [Burkholderia multivorans]VWB67233.1 hypothetical protein BUB20358_03129 [Burkholderia ubonensis]